MATVRNIETRSEDGKLRLVSRPDGRVTVEIDPTDDTVAEESLLEAVLEYAHERGLRRRRRVAAGKPRKTRRSGAKATAANGAAPPEPTEAASAVA